MPDWALRSLRTLQEVARRAAVLHAVVGAGHRESRPDIINWLRLESLWMYVTPDERALLEAPAPTERQMMNATWRAEALLPLLWSLHLFDEMPPPVGLCDVRAMQVVLPPFLGSTAEWFARVQLRSIDEVEFANEEIYEIHWSVRDAQLCGRPVPHGYHPGIVQERHHALNWLVRYGNFEWDDVAIDT